MARGCFVTLEGIEGSGKSSLLTPLKSHFEQCGKKVLVTREPGGTDLGNKLRDLILHYEAEQLHPMTELLLIQAARAQHVAQVVLPAMQTYDLVLCDRFTHSTLAYQCAGRGLDRALVDHLNGLATMGLRPDLTILLDLPTEAAHERRKSRAIVQDRFENEKSQFHDIVRAAYLDLAQEKNQRIIVFDASLAPSELKKAVATEIDKTLSKHA